MLPPCHRIVVATVCFMHYSLANSRTSEKRERFSIIHCVCCCHEKWIYSGCINSLQLQYETTSIYHHTDLHQTKYLLVPQNVLKLLLNFGKPELTLFVVYVTQTEKGVMGGFCLSQCKGKMTFPRHIYIHIQKHKHKHIQLVLSLKYQLLRCPVTRPRRAVTSVV